MSIYRIATMTQVHWNVVSPTGKILHTRTFEATQELAKELGEPHQAVRIPDTDYFVSHPSESGMWHTNTEAGARALLHRLNTLARGRQGPSSVWVFLMFDLHKITFTPSFHLVCIDNRDKAELFALEHEGRITEMRRVWEEEAGLQFEDVNVSDFTLEAKQARQADHELEREGAEI